MYIENMQMLYFILNGGKWRRTFLQTWIHTMRILKKQKLNASITYLYKSPMEFMWCSLMPLITSELPINIHHELQIFFEKNYFFVSFM